MKTEQTENANSGTGFIDLFQLDHSKFQEEVIKPIDGVEEVKTDIIPLEEKDDDEDKDKDKSDKKDDVVIPEDTTKNQNAEATDYETLIEDLSDVLAIGEDVEIEASAKGLKQLIIETAEKAKVAGVTEYKAKFDTVAKGLFDIIESGGTVEDYINTTGQVNFEQVPLTTEDGDPILINQLNLVEDYLKLQGFDQDEIQEKLKDLQDSNLLEKEARLAKKKLVLWQQNEITATAAKRKEESDAKVAEEKQKAEKLKETILSKTEIAGFKITKEQSKQLLDYVTKPTKNGKTQFINDTEGKDEPSLLYAFFAMSGFNKEALSKEISTAKTIKFKKAVSNFEDTNLNKKSSQQIRHNVGEELDLSSWKIV